MDAVPLEEPSDVLLPSVDVPSDAALPSVDVLPSAAVVPSAVRQKKLLHYHLQMHFRQRKLLHYLYRQSWLRNHLPALFRVESPRIAKLSTDS